MNIVSSALRVFAVISLAIAGQLRAEVTVRFRATIDQSQFVTTGYTPGSVITGWYTYDQSSMNTDSGYNYTSYKLLEMHVFIGGAEYKSSNVGLSIVHFLSQYLANPTDEYAVTGYSLYGPPVEGFLNGWAEVHMSDTDNSVYGEMTPPYPIDLPDPSLFEAHWLSISLLQGPPMIGQSLHAWIDSITRDDSEPPTILSVTASPNVLWPPNGKMVPVYIWVDAEDNVGVTSTKIVAVTSNEPAKSSVRGRSETDWQITGDLTLNLKADRFGTGNGRIYTITVQCADGSGNVSTDTVTVKVPHDQGK